MTFKNIDIEIGKFVDGKNMTISREPHSDWLVFEWRQLSWSRNGVAYLIEIYPNFANKEKITSWTFYTAAYYDNEDKRFYIKREFAKEVSLDSISQNINQLLDQSYAYITGIAKDQIPETKD